jgi:DNA-3-methyladenine glycosylase II
MIMIRTEAALEAALDVLVAADPRLAPFAAMARPLPLRGAEPGFRSFARIIVSQQVSTLAAEAIWRRLEAAAGPVTAQGFLDAGPEAWREGGLSRPKQKTIEAAARAVIDGSLDLDAVERLDAEDAVAEMAKVWGVGRWTAEVYLLFACGHPDVFPARDLALQVSLQECFGLEERPGEREATAMASAWRPARSIAARLLWAVHGVRRRKDAPLPL